MTEDILALKMQLVVCNEPTSNTVISPLMASLLFLTQHIMGFLDLFGSMFKKKDYKAHVRLFSGSSGYRGRLILGVYSIHMCHFPIFLCITIKS